MNHLIGLTGLKQSGKSTAARYLRDTYGFHHDDFAGPIRALVNVNVLSEGFDASHIDCVVMLRPTKSPGIYYQQVGRGFRLHPSKSDCLVLDFAGNALEHGPVDQIKVAKPRSNRADEVTIATARECPTCHTIGPVSVRVCPELSEDVATGCCEYDYCDSDFSFSSIIGLGRCDKCE